MIKKNRFYKFKMTKPALQRILERRLQSEVEYGHTQGGCRKEINNITTGIQRKTEGDKSTNSKNVRINKLK